MNRYLIPILIFVSTLFGLDSNLTAPSIPSVGVISAPSLPPNTPEVEEPNATISTAPTIPEVGEPNTTISTAPTIPEVGEPNTTISTAPAVPEIGEPNTTISTAPTIPEIGEPNTTISTAPAVPEVEEKPFEYIIGNIRVPKDSNLTLEIELISLDYQSHVGIVRDDGFFYIQLPKMVEGETKEFYIKLTTIDQNGITSEYFVDGATNQVVLANRVKYVFNREVAQFFPDVSPLSVNIDTENIGNIDITDIENSLISVSGNIVANGDIDFDLEALNILTGETLKFPNENLGNNRFGFKLPKDGEYIFLLHLEESQNYQASSYYLGYKDINSSELSLFSISDIDVNSSDIPQFPKYISLQEDGKFNIDLVDYFNSLVSIEGTITIGKDENITITAIDSSTGEFFNSTKLDSSKTDRYSLVLGADLKGKSLSLFLILDSNPEIAYLYNSATSSLKLVNLNEFIESEKGFIPPSNIYQPIQISSNSLTANMDISTIQIFQIVGNVSIPPTLKLGAICKDELGNIFYQECNSSMQQIGFNGISIEFFNPETNGSTWIDIDSNSSFTFQSDTPQPLIPILHLFQYDETLGEMFHWQYTLSDYNSSDSLIPYREDTIIPPLYLGETNTTIELDFNLANLLLKRWKLSGAITLGENENILISILDALDNSVIGILDTNSSQYSIYLNKFRDSNSSNNGVVLEITISTPDGDEVFFFDGKKLTPLERVEYTNIDGRWVIDTSTTGVLNLDDSKSDIVLDIDIPTLLSDLEKSTYRIFGTISGEANSSLTIQIVDMDTDLIVATDSVNLDSNGEGNYSIDIFRQGNYGVVVVSETETLFYNGERFLDIDYFDGTYPKPLQLNSEFDIDLSIPADIYISGTFQNSSYFNGSTISAYSIDGRWLGEGVIIDGNYSIPLPVAEVGEDIILKISKDGESYYLGSNNILLDSSDIEIDYNGTFELPNTFEPIVLQEKTNQNGDLQELLQFIQQQLYSIYGDVTSLKSSIIAQPINIDTGEYLPSFEIGDDNYSIELANEGNYSLYLYDGEIELFYDFNHSKFIPADSVGYIYKNGNWIPNPEETGYITLTSEKRKEKIDLDFSNIDSLILSLSGKILFPSDSILDSSRYGYISVIDRVSGDEVAFSEISPDTNLSTTSGVEYSFNVAVENSDMATRQLVFKIYLYEYVDGIFSTKEIVYNFKEGKGENGKVIPLQDSDYLEISSSKDDIYLDLTTFGKEDRYLNLNINMPYNMSLNDSSNSLTLYILSDKGDFIDWLTLDSDENISINLGNRDGKYIVYLQLDHIGDEIYSQSFYLDFVDENRTNVVYSDEVEFIEAQNGYIPNVSPIYVDRNISIVVDIEDRQDHYISGHITSSTEWNYLDIVLKDYKTGREYLSSVIGGNYYIPAVKDGNYTIKLIGETKGGEDISIFLRDGGYIPLDETNWKIGESGDSFYFYPDEVTLLEINQDISNYNIDLGEIGTQERYEINISVDRDVDWGEIFIPNSSTYKYVSCYFGECVKEGSNTILPFENIAPKDGYYIQIAIDGKEYIYNPAIQEFESGVEWIAVDEDGNQVCSTSSNSWDCNWTDSYNWTWKPDVEPLNMSNLNSDVSLTFPIADESQLSATISFGEKFKNRYFLLLIYDINSPLFYFKDLESDENGDLNISLSVKPAKSYRVELLDSDNYFVINYDGSNYQLIRNSQSWEDDFITPKAGTIFDLSSDLDIGTISLPQSYLVNFHVDNLDSDEVVFVKLYGDSNSFGGANIDSPETISLIVEGGTYTPVVYPSNHNSGYLVKRESDTNWTDFNWSYEDSISLTIDRDANFTISLPSNSELKYLSGKVNLGDGDIEAGWIEAYSPYNREGAIVEDDGSFIIKGLKPSLEYNYTVEYHSWNSDISIVKNVGNWGVGNRENFYIDLPQSSYTYSGTITYSGDEAVDIRAMLILYNVDSEEWKVVRKTKLDKDGGYKFENVQPIDGYRYYISAGVRKQNLNGVTYLKYNATDGDSNLSIFELNSSIDISVVQTTN